jgi:hypothetical protein
VTTEKNPGATNTGGGKTRTPIILGLIDGIEDETIPYLQTERGTETIEDDIEAAPEIGDGREIRKRDAAHVLAPQESVEVQGLVIITDPQNYLGQILPQTQDLIGHTVIHTPRKREILEGSQKQQGEKKRKKHLIPTPSMI